MRTRGGLRIRHYLHKSVMVVIRDRARPFLDRNGRAAPMDCHLCGQHHYKTYHLELDAEGTVLVSHGVWEALKGMVPHVDAATGKAYPAAGFELANTVPDPPTQQLAVRPLTLETSAPAPAPTRRERITQ